MRPSGSGDTLSRKGLLHYPRSILGLLASSVLLCAPVAALNAEIAVAQEQDRSRQTRQNASTPIEPFNLEGRLDENSKQLSDESYYNIHEFQGQAGQQIRIDLTSSEFDAFLILIDPSGNKIAEDNNAAGGTSARITIALPATGTYQILANAYDAGGTGRYQLSVQPATNEDLALQEAVQLNQQAEVLHDRGNYAEALPLYQRSLAIREQALGLNHPNVATSLNNLALLYKEQGNYAEALPLYQRSLAIREQALGADHPNVAASLNNLAALYYEQGNYNEALPLFQRSLDIFEQALGPNHPNVATSLSNLARLYQEQGNYVEAIPLYQQSLAIWEQALGPNHPEVATGLNNLAALYYEQGNYNEALPLFQRSLDIFEQALGPNHPSVATSLSNLARLYQEQGNYDEALLLHQRSLTIREQALGADHPNVATSLNNLALLYKDQGNYAEALPLYQRSLAVLKQALGPNHPSVATGLNDLAALYYEQGNYTEALPLYQQSLAIRERALGANHPNVAQSLNNLAALYVGQGNYTQALPLLQRSLAAEQALGPNHPNVATSLNNLARLYQEQGNYAEALPLFQRSLTIREQALGPDHPDVATSLNNLAALYREQGDPGRALEFLQQSSEIEEANLVLNLNIGSEFRKQAYMATLAGTTATTLSLHLQSTPDNPDAARLAFTTLLRRKGRVLDATAESQQRLRQNLSPADQSLFDQLQIQRSQLAALWGLLSRSPSEESEIQSPQQYQQYREQIDRLTQSIAQLENTLAQRSAEFRVASQPVTIDQVQAQIPSDAVLVEFVRYQPLINSRAATPTEQWGKPRYAAYVLDAQGNLRWTDLGEAQPIDDLIAEFQCALQQQDGCEGSPDPDLTPRQLDALLMQPLRPLLGNATHLLISPDSQLNLLSFAALADEQEQYLVRRYTITTLSSGRDLLRLQTQVASQQPPFIFAAPNYDAPNTPPQPIASNRSATGNSSSTVTSDRRSRDSNTLTAFGDLPYTRTEAEAIAPLLPGATVLMDDQATVAALQQLNAPRVLHLATHGFFLPDQDQPLDQRSPDSQVARIENPLLRSGLALAGANVRPTIAETANAVNSDDGLLTALEAASLNLHGTDLVVLSACETGVGDIRNGEGVYGLRRAIVLAGAESQLISLWGVGDRSTSHLMQLYYQNLNSGMGRSEALRQAQLTMLDSENANWRIPSRWAAFVFSGDWRSMSQPSEEIR